MNRSGKNDFCTEDNLPIYILYTELRASDFGQLLLSFDGLYEATFRGYTDIIGISFTKRPRLEIQEIHTGNSIKFEFTEGWLPNVYSDVQHDIVIGVPKKLGIPLLIGYFLLASTQKVLEVRNEYLDGCIIKMEIRLKEAEISKLLFEKDANKLSNLRERSDEIIRSIVKNETFVNVQIYGVEIKQGHIRHQFEDKSE